MLVAAAGLGYSSYRSAARLAERSRASVVRANRALGSRLVDQIEKSIIDGDRTFFQLVSLDDPREFRELWSRIVRVSPAVQSVSVLDEGGALLHLVAPLKRRAMKRFRKRFVEEIVPDLRLDQLPADKHKHIHKKYGDAFYLLSYIRRRSADADYFIVLNINLPHVVQTLLAGKLREVQDATEISVHDEDGQVIYGPAVSASEAVFEGRFPTTLYKWRLRIGPRPVEQGSGAARLSNVMLIGTAVGVIALGILLMLGAVRSERRANQLKSDFISNVSHELKTPLSLIRMFGELLSLGRGNSDTRREYAGIIMRESDRLTSLIDNVLDFSRIERGKAAYEMNRGNLRDVVRRAVDLCAYRAEKAGVRLLVELGPVPEVVFDESALTLLVINLVENAIKYGKLAGPVCSEAGLDEKQPDAEGPWVRISLENTDEHIVLIVRDNGPGIAPDEKAHVFERFFRGRTAGRQRGSGIGLSIVEHIAKAHEGRVVVDDCDVGATFRVTLPLSAPHDYQEQQGQQGDSASSSIAPPPSGSIHADVSHGAPTGDVGDG